MKPLFALFVLLASSAFATNIDNAQYTASLSKWQFVTDMQFTTAFTPSANGQALNSGDAVASGSTITVVPSITATWATPDLSIVSIYPICTGAPCQMIDYSTVSTNRPIVWLPAATFDAHKRLGDSNDWNRNETFAAQLEPFVTQPMTYDQGSGRPLQPGKEGGANIYCKGTVEVLDGATIVASSGVPAASLSFTLAGAGSHSITVQLKDVACFGAVEKHPVAKGTSSFYYYYFTHKGPTTVIPATMAVSAITPIVVSSCNITHTTYTTTGSVDEDYFMLITPVTNNGAPAQVKSVASGNSDYTVEPFPVALCGTLGFPSSLCPPSNGFNANIPTSSAQDTYVLVTRTGSPASMQTLITYTAQTSGGSCTDAISLGNPDCPVVVCSVDPPAFSMRTQDILNAAVACENLAGQSIPCIDANWSWGSGLVGDFITRTSASAEAYSTSLPGSSGTLNYNSCSARCFSGISINGPPRCRFNPANATVLVGDSQHFALECDQAPTSATYDVINGLIGITLDDTPATAGTTFTADAVSAGDLRGVVTLPADVSPLIGAVVLAPIDAVPSNIDSCAITPATVTSAEHLCTNNAMLFNVQCFFHGAQVPCAGSNWYWADGLTGGFNEADRTHAIAYPTSPLGSSGTLNFAVGAVRCASNVSLALTQDQCLLWCDFNPASANLKYNESKYFALSCMDNRNGTPVRFTPQEVPAYDLIDGLAGSLGSQTAAGTNYTAPPDNSTGQLRGYVSVEGISGFGNLAGTNAFARIKVGNGSDDGGTDDKGDTDWCAIDGLGVSTLTVHQGESGWFQIKCGKGHNETCAVGDVGWVVSPDGTMQHYSGDNLGFTYNIGNSPLGTRFTIQATIKSMKHGCSKDLYVDKPDCYQQS